MASNNVRSHCSNEQARRLLPLNGAPFATMPGRVGLRYERARIGSVCLWSENACWCQIVALLLLLLLHSILLEMRSSLQT